MSYEVPVPDDRIKDSKQLGEFLSDLTDEEIKHVAKIVNVVRAKYAGLSNTVENLEKLRDEVLTSLAEQANVLATLDVVPCMSGLPPTIEIIGKVPGDSIHKDGFDHEKKSYEVNKAVELGEDYRGQKEPSNKRRGK